MPESHLWLPKCLLKQGQKYSNEQKQLQVWAEKYGRNTQGSIPGTELKAPYIFGPWGQNEHPITIRAAFTEWLHCTRHSAKSAAGMSSSEPVNNRGRLLNNWRGRGFRCVFVWQHPIKSTEHLLISKNTSYVSLQINWPDCPGRNKIFAHMEKLGYNLKNKPTKH